MKDRSVETMLDEIAVALRSGDEGVLHWLRDQMELTGASEVAVDLALGLIARLMPDEREDREAALLSALMPPRRLH